MRPLCLLCRDGNGLDTKNAQSLYRKIEVLDATGATNIVGGKYHGTTSVAPGGKLETEASTTTTS